MKLNLTIIALAALLAACSTTPEGKARRCTAYSEVYSLYLASAEVRQPSKEEIAGAAAAALFLRIYCGWVGPRGVEVNDANGVPVIVQP